MSATKETIEKFKLLLEIIVELDEQGLTKKTTLEEFSEKIIPRWVGNTQVSEDMIKVYITAITCTYDQKNKCVNESTIRKWQVKDIQKSAVRELIKTDRELVNTVGEILYRIKLERRELGIEKISRILKKAAILYKKKKDVNNNIRSFSKIIAENLRKKGPPAGTIRTILTNLSKVYKKTKGDITKKSLEEFIWAKKSYLIDILEKDRNLVNTAGCIAVRLNRRNRGKFSEYHYYKNTHIRLEKLPEIIKRIYKW